ncbi:hypothetical protein JHW43_000632 [Diplocarpon mali]|nr:hypothetical protein JHW43_000632 [Diplocarpon mali]
MVETTSQKLLRSTDSVSRPLREPGEPPRSEAASSRQEMLGKKRGIVRGRGQAPWRDEDQEVPTSSEGRGGLSRQWRYTRQELASHSTCVQSVMRGTLEPERLRAVLTPFSSPSRSPMPDVPGDAATGSGERCCSVHSTPDAYAVPSPPSTQVVRG